ncbi:p-loop containing nucleoside triphosphate hydrolase [Fusarium flagelliforme]|uniref:p-loop containing nucleoside triphosphate hydrolase n=1 Tax=Fusarium flagelliforme TaxID=2675880 RepID=A0A395N392_9HYPO|nr:p-loop containing nucleoside triphosphate hydrolase [Fusarium flagelliforme]
MHTETETQATADISSIGTGELCGLAVMEHKQEASPRDEAETNPPESQVQPAENDSTAEPPATEEIVKETAKDPVSQTSQEEVQKPPTASLWCSKNGRSHAHLAEWNILKCPSCEQDLRRPEEEVKEKQEPKVTDQPKSDSDESESESDSDQSEPADEADTRDESHDDEEARPCLQYSIRYLDEAGYHAATEPWHERLDLNTERKHVVKNTNVVLEIETIVQTSIKKDEYRRQYEKDDLLKKGILKNPAYRLAIMKSQFVIHSKLIMRTLMHLVDYYPAVNLSPEPITITEPYPLIIHHWDVIQAYLKTFPGHTDYQEGSDSMAPFPAGRRLKACDEETHQHFGMLIESIEPSLLEKVRDEKALWRRSVPMATFPMLWLLYKPGTDVYIDADGDIMAGVVKSVTHQIRHVPGSSAVTGYYRIEYWYLDFDGRRLGRAESSRWIVPYEGEQDITTLGIYPCSFIDDQDDGATRERLENRGEQFFKLLGGAQMEYKGESLGAHKRWYEGRVMIDIATYYNTVEDQKFPRPHIGKVKDRTVTEGDDYDDDDDEIEGQKDPTFKWACYDNINPKVTKTLDLDRETIGVSAKHRYFLCPKRVIGFVLKSRKWDLLDIECCHEPRVNYKAIDSLVLNEERKTMIKSLVYRYTDKNRVDPQVPAPWAADTIRDKGEGQIFLLHGGPGVGKTFTAECIAESTGRPLLSLTCADIGTEDKEVEERLSDWFSLAETWGAVMLLDEADVFLERRNRGDLARNSLVSVFLRSMEYYRGILFLTTNRVGHFDDAFISRIHIVIKYDNFDMASRERIWSQFFKKLATERGKYITISNDAKKYVTKNKEMISIPWNGREIRNAFQTAVALAEYRFAMSEDKEEGDKACLEREDFQQVCEMTGAFKKYLKSLSGFDEAERALNDEARKDNPEEED